MNQSSTNNYNKALFADFTSEDFWNSTLDSLTTTLDPATHLGLFSLDQKATEVYTGRLLEEGYIVLPPLLWDPWFADITRAIKQLDQLKLPLPFIFTCCQPWMLALKLNRIIETLLGEPCKMLPDFWVWHVDPRNKEQGWKPHRDKGPNALFTDGRPKSLTVWLPLTDATTENGCMYMVPANRDQAYKDTVFDSSKVNLQDVVALPARAGSALIWNQAVTHWGSRTLDRNVEPRISIAFEFQVASEPPFNNPLLAPMEIPEFETRLSLICKQILQYKHMYAIDPAIEQSAIRYMQQHPLTK